MSMAEKKVKKYKYLVLLILSVSVSQLTAQFHSDKLYIKFKEGFEYTDNKLFESTLGDHTVKPIISQVLLEFINRRYAQNYGVMPKHSTMQNNAIYISQKLSELESIYIIEYTKAISPQIAARKLNSIHVVEYAEPVPVHSFSYVPNDPRKKDQYYLEKIQCFEAWDHLEDADTVVVGIVDTGIDYTHEDLSANIFININETGEDEYGNDKSDNGIDDDGNGFIDDWRGWDFVGSGSNDGDNDPIPGHLHGTHVGGTVGAVVDNEVGIAGICRNVKLMPVKVGSDDPQSVSVYGGYEGILYAAAMGADVINCSWGSYSKSNAEQEIIDAAISLGAVIVAAAGNEGQNSEQYPASFDGVMSVAALDTYDERAYFSNYHRTVDVSAPGYEIYATVPGNWYNYLNGTSMASPVAAGVAALVKQKHPEYNPLQVIEHVKQCCDDIYSINEGFEGLLGKGRVNAYNAVTIENPRSVILIDKMVKDENNDLAYDAKETIKVDLTFLNVLSPVKSLVVKAKETSFGGIEFINGEVYLGDMQTMEEILKPDGIIFRVPENIPPDFDCMIELVISDEDGFEAKEYISMTLSPSYRTMNGNNITVTFNNRGNIAFNDYPSNQQGEGFKYRNSSNILFEGALMVAVSPEKISNVARGSAQSAQNRAFFSDEVFGIKIPGEIAEQQGSVSFRDQARLDKDVGVSIDQKIYQFNTQKDQDHIICVYDIMNISPFDYDSLFAGLYFDWDIGPSGRDNQTYFDDELRYGFTKNFADDTLPIAAVQLLSFQKLNYYAIDNDATSEENPGVWDGFTYSEKWKMLSGGIQRRESNVTDISQVIGAGPIALKAGDSVRVAFAIFAATSEEELDEISMQAYKTGELFGLSNGNINVIPDKAAVSEIYPNPNTQTDLHFAMRIPYETGIEIEIYDLSGARVDNVMTSNILVAGFYDFTVNIENISQGTYFLKISTKSETFFKSFVIMR